MGVDSGWPGGSRGSQLTDGPDAGLVVYVAEDVTPTVQAGQHVSALGNNSTDATNNNSTVYATGSALTRLAPDRVFISIGVETTDKTANDALSLNSGLMNNIISELRSDGLKPNETRTTFFNIFPLYNYTESGTRLNVTGFTVTNTLQIEISNLDNVSQWIDTAVASGANSINSIDFSVTEKKLEDTRTKLITDAIGNAKQKAEVVASAVQLSITGVKSIVVDGSTINPPLPPQPFYRDSVSAQGRNCLIFDTNYSRGAGSIRYCFWYLFNGVNVRANLILKYNQCTAYLVLYRVMQISNVFFYCC